MAGVSWAYSVYSANVLGSMWSHETGTLAKGVTALFARSVVRLFRICAFDVLVLPRLRLG